MLGPEESTLSKYHSWDAKAFAYVTSGKRRHYMRKSIAEGLKDARAVAYSLPGMGTYVPAAIEVLDSIAGINARK